MIEVASGLRSCVNYRRHNGERPEGDRILILEDTNNDGVTDTSKVFYQGRENRLGHGNLRPRR